MKARNSTVTARCRTRRSRPRQGAGVTPALSGPGRLRCRRGDSITQSVIGESGVCGGARDQHSVDAAGVVAAEDASRIVDHDIFGITHPRFVNPDMGVVAALTAGL